MKNRMLRLGAACVLVLGAVLGISTLTKHSTQSAIVKDREETRGEESPSEIANQGRLEEGKNIDNLPEKEITDEIYRRVSSAVVTVYGARELGSGMIVKPEGLILTNKHVVQNSSQLAIKTVSGQVYQGRVVNFDLQHDLALVKVIAQPLQLPTVTLAKTASLKPGDRIYAIGSPAGKAGTLTTGTFICITEYGSLQTSKELLNPGNSGGPLLNAQGEVVGVNKGLLQDHSGLATSVTAIAPLINRYELINKTR